MAATRDSSLIDDLIRAHAVEYYTPVHNAYYRALRDMTGQRAPRGPGAWKAWLAQEAAAGRLKIDYLPLQPDVLPPDDRAGSAPGGPVGARASRPHGEGPDGQGAGYEGASEALRYLVANDHRQDVQTFLKSDWLGRFLALDD